MMDKTVKIAKYLAQAGVASRRKAEALVKQGLVSVNGKISADPALRVNPKTDKILYRGKPLSPAQKVYYLLNKPVGYTCTAQDPHAEKLVGELVPAEPRVWPVGRLDKMTSGLLILTNDGDLALSLTHPRYRVEKEYEITADFPLTEDEIAAVQKGVSLEDGFIRPDRFEKIGGKRYRIVIHSGKKRVVRRIVEKIGKSVAQLKRTRVGSLELQNLPLGKWRRLSPAEIKKLAQRPMPADAAD
jgi:23S rRNA pseudouridine2605 synthase